MKKFLLTLSLICLGGTSLLAGPTIGGPTISATGGSGSGSGSGGASGIVSNAYNLTFAINAYYTNTTTYDLFVRETVQLSTTTGGGTIDCHFYVSTNTDTVWESTESDTSLGGNLVTTQVKADQLGGNVPAGGVFMFTNVTRASGAVCAVINNSGLATYYSTNSGSSGGSALSALFATQVGSLATNAPEIVAIAGTNNWTVRTNPISWVGTISTAATNRAPYWTKDQDGVESHYTLYDDDGLSLFSIQNKNFRADRTFYFGSVSNRAIAFVTGSSIQSGSVPRMVWNFVDDNDPDSVYMQMGLVTNALMFGSSTFGFGGPTIQWDNTGNMTYGPTNGSTTIRGTNFLVAVGTNSISVSTNQISLNGNTQIGTNNGILFYDGLNDVNRLMAIPAGDETLRFEGAASVQSFASDTSISAQTWAGNVSGSGGAVLTNAPTMNLPKILGGLVVVSNAVSNWPTTPASKGACAIVSSNGYPYMLLSTNGSAGSVTWTGTNKLGW